MELRNQKIVEKIPDVRYVREELARNQRERVLLQKLLVLAEKKTAIDELNAGLKSEVSDDE